MVKLVTLPNVTITTSGTRIRLPAVDNVARLWLTTGANTVTVGDNTVTATLGRVLPANSTTEFYVADEDISLDSFYADSGTSGATLSISFLKRQ
jgi:hypothetical protein